MSGKRLKRQLIKQRLFTKNRLVILNEETFEELFSFKLNLVNVFVGLTTLSIFLIAVTTYIIAFTPLREYIPGYASTTLKREARQNAIQSDSLKKVIEGNNAYLASIKKVLAGDVEPAKLSRDSIQVQDQDAVQETGMQPSKAEIKLREEVALEDKYNVFEKAKPLTGLVLFSPVSGHISQEYDAKKKHFAVAIAIPKDTPVKAITAGTVILADWTPANGNIIILRHNNGILSVYKNAASLTKTQGDIVRSGEVIALAGSAGKQSSGSYLHFELWKDGYPINPTQLIDFE